jgi:hypothetical protein
VVSIPIPNTVVVVGTVVVVVVVVVAVFGVFVVGKMYVMVDVPMLVPVVEGKLRNYSSMIDYDISYSTMIE